MRKFHSLSGQITRRILLPMLLTMAITASLVFYLAVGGMSILGVQHFNDILALTNEKVDKMLVTAEVSAYNNRSEVEENLYSPEAVYAALEKETSLNPNIVGCGVAFIPNYFPSEGKWFEPYAEYLDSTHVETMQLGSAEHDYFQSDWYLDAIAEKTPFWAKPYFDEYDEEEKTLLCSYILSVKEPDTGKIVGAFAVDFSLAELREQLHEFDESPLFPDLRDHSTDGESNEKSLYCFIIGRDGEYIVHPDADRILEKNFFDFAVQQSDTSCLALGKKMLEGLSGRETVVIDGRKCIVYFAPIHRVGWSMGVVVEQDTVRAPGLIIGSIILFLILLGLLAIALISRSTIKRQIKPLKHLALSAEEVAQGNFDAQLPTMRTNNEIKQLRDSFEDMQHSLVNYIDQLTETTAVQATLENELSIARNIQMSMLPKTFPPFPDRNDVDIYGELIPAKAVGGDFYDFYLHGDTLYFCIGDVSGKGIPASLVMAVTISMFHSLAGAEHSADEIVAQLNDTICRRNETLMFATLFVGVLNLSNGLLQYCNAGHNAPLLITSDASGCISGVTALPVDANLPIGIDRSISYSPQETELSVGSTLLLYTDGLTEAENLTHELLGVDRVVSSLLALGTVQPKDTVEALLKTVHQFVGEAEQSDDLTLLSLSLTAH